MQGCFASLFLLPLLEDALGLWVLVKKMFSQQVAVIRSCLIDGAMLVWLSQGRQRLYHEPCRVVGVFDGQLLLVCTLWEQLGEVNGLGACLMLRDRDCFGDIFFIRKDGQIVLLAIAEAVALGSNLTDEQRCIGG